MAARLFHGGAARTDGSRSAPFRLDPFLPLFLVVFLTSVPFLGASCGYRTGLAPRVPRAALPEDALDDPARLGLEGTAMDANATSVTRTIGIQIFGNESLLPNLERDLHSAFSDAARRHVALRLVSPSRADLFIRGRIANFRRGAGARLADNQVVETLEILTIEAELIDGETGAVLGRAQAQPTVGAAIDVPGREVEQRERALSNAADRLLLLLLAGLEYGVTRPGDPLLPEIRKPLAESPLGPGLQGVGDPPVPLTDGQKVAPK
ncbi:hypothetical protein Poly30_18110 [Planctomycetes bacterium Poly30]|uniref:Lipoprotein n=1 Tax=Saltatorellus ferox TaxID=2528018 RepID=A0A518EQF1_9BACT|nr:hypothetical protein Poly30_18110 [Planctomycetes bacterium Poly30]